MVKPVLVSPPPLAGEGEGGGLNAYAAAVERMSVPRPLVVVAPDAAGEGSVAAVVRNQVRELARDREVFLVTPTLPDALPPGVRGVQVQSPDFTWLHRFGHVPRLVAQAIATRRAVARLCSEHRPGALLAHSHALAMLAGVPLRRQLGLPCLLFVHADIHDRPAGTYDALLTAFYRWAGPRAYRTADRVLAISPAMAEAAIRQGAAHERVRIIPNGVDPAEIGLEAAPPRTGREPGEALRLLFVGRLSVEKGVADLIGACVRLAERGVEFSLEIVGDGPLRAELEGMVRAGGLGERIHFRGACPRTQLGPRYRAADLTCVPSLSEPQGLVVLESLIAGTPVVASAVGGIPDMVKDGVNGRLVPPGDPEALSDALVAAQAQLDLLRAGCAATDDWSWASVGRRLRAALDEVTPGIPTVS